MSQKIIKDVDEKRGLVQVTAWDERHYLKPRKNPDTGIPEYLAVPSVTWITSYYWKSPYLTKWIADKGYDEAEAIKKAAGDKGSRVHLALEMILSGEEFRIDTKVLNKTTGEMQELSYEELLCVKSFLDWKRDTEQDYLIESIAVEVVVFSEIHGYAGTVDWVARLTPKPEGKNPFKLGGPTVYVIDHKTSKQVWREHELQISAYRMALENGENPLFENNSTKIVDLSGLKTAILQVGYDRNKAGYKFTEVDDAFPLFKVAQQIWKAEVGDNTPGFTKRDFPIVLSPAAKRVEGVTEMANTADAVIDTSLVGSTTDMELPVGKKATKKTK